MVLIDSMSEEEFDCRSAESGKMIGADVNTSYTVEMNKLSSFEELIKVN